MVDVFGRNIKEKMLNKDSNSQLIQFLPILERILKFLEKDFRYMFHLSPLIDEAYLECVQDAILDRLLFKKLRT